MLSTHLIVWQIYLRLTTANKKQSTAATQMFQWEASGTIFIGASQSLGRRVYTFASVCIVESPLIDATEFAVSRYVNFFFFYHVFEILPLSQNQISGWIWHI